MDEKFLRAVEGLISAVHGGVRLRDLAAFLPRRTDRDIRAAVDELRRRGRARNVLGRWGPVAPLRKLRPQPRPVSISETDRLGLEDLAETPEDRELRAERPKTREDCVGGPRPCPFASCRYHLYLDVNPSTGSVKLNFPGSELWEIKETCSLDVADRGGTTLEEVGEILNLTRERIRQIEVRGLLALKAAPDVRDFAPPKEKWRKPGTRVRYTDPAVKETADKQDSEDPEADE